MSYFWATAPALNYKICRNYGEYSQNCSVEVKVFPFKIFRFCREENYKILNNQKYLDQHFLDFPELDLAIIFLF